MKKPDRILLFFCVASPIPFHVVFSFYPFPEINDCVFVGCMQEMIFRGTDTTALLTEWTMAEMVLNPRVQRKVQEELDIVVGKTRSVMDSDICKLPYLQAVVKETLRMHPPGPLLSWARLSTRDTNLADGKLCVPAGTTAMVNMWSITHDPLIWDSPDEFRPERFLESEGGENVDVRGNDLRLAPFGSGRRSALESLWVFPLSISVWPNCCTISSG